MMKEIFIFFINYFLVRNKCLIIISLDSQLVSKLSLTKPSDYHYLNQTECYKVNGIDDLQEFKDTKDAMNLMNFSNQDEIFEMLAGI